MKKILIIGSSGADKSTLAKKLNEKTIIRYDQNARWKFFAGNLIL